MKYLLTFFLIIFITGCNKQKYVIGNCLIPKDKSSPTAIIRVVSISDDDYLVFSHFLSDGKLILAEDYGKVSATEIKSKYVLVECPFTESVFSPDKYLNKNDKTKQ